ncbi:MAG: PorT family protein [Candidatus Aminicenantes bacterium]|nr:MAG: PorT family protein [Candidatus Aminicenantes bacterium]
MKKRLRKALAFGVALLLVGSLIFASQWEWGLKGGIVRSKAGFSHDLPYITIENLNTFSIGSFLSFFFVKNQLGIQPEIHYAVKGFYVLEEDLGQEISSKYKISYVEIPVLIAYKLPVKGRIKPGLVFGPYLGFAHKVMEIQTAFGNTEKRELDNNLKQTDVGLVFGANVRYRLGSLNLLLSVRYSLGLVNISRNIMEVSYDFSENDTIKNRALTVSLGIAFIPPASR